MKFALRALRQSVSEGWLKMELLIDLGDIYTKFMLVENHRLIRRGSFPSVIASYPPPDEFFEFNERIYFDDEKPYLVGWPATLAKNYLILGDSPQLNHCRILVKKILFDNLKSAQKVNLHLGVDTGQKAKLIQKMVSNLNSKTIPIAAGYIYKDDLEKNSLTVKGEICPTPLTIFDFLKQRENFSSMLIIDIGYFRTKLYIVHAKKGLAYSRTVQAGTEVYCTNLLRQFKSEKTNPFILMKQFELTAPYIRVNNRSYDVSSIMENICWDLNKELTLPAANALKDYFNRTGQTVDSFFITGGGVALQGDLLRSWLVKEGYKPEQILFDRLPTYTVVNSMREGMKRKS